VFEKLRTPTNTGHQALIKSNSKQITYMGFVPSSTGNAKLLAEFPTHKFGDCLKNEVSIRH